MRCSFGAWCCLIYQGALCPICLWHPHTSVWSDVRWISSLAAEAGTDAGVRGWHSSPFPSWRSLSSHSRSGRRARPRLATDSATACVPAQLSSIASPSGRSDRRTSGSATWPSGRWRCCWCPRATRSPAACSRPKSGGRTRRSMARCQTLAPFTLCPDPRTPHPPPHHPSPGVARARRPSGARGRSSAHA